MTTVQEIEEAITHLKEDDLSALHSWLDDFTAQKWDSQFEEDVKDGKLDGISQKAINDFRNGNYRKT